MKIYIALFTSLITVGHLANISATDAADHVAVDGSTHPHLRALVGAAVEVAGCSRGTCTENWQCGVKVCKNRSGSTCGGRCIYRSCVSGECNIGNGCSSGTCSTKRGTSLGCYKCVVTESALSPGQDHEDEDEMEASSLRASILKEE
eukprot:scaffold9984_cov148-Skeletonema_dohrnii-CCMP3373.AAC.6